MQIALLTNTAWLDEELATFKALLVGMLDEGIGAVKVVPEEVVSEELGIMGRQIGWRSTRWGWLKRRRLLALAPTLAELEVSLLHATDGRLWHAAAALGRAMDLPVVYQANSRLDLRLVEPVVKSLSDHEARFAFLATTQPLGDAVRQLAGPGVEVEVIAPGVHVPGERAGERDPEQALCAIVSGSDRMDGYYQALFEGLVEFVRERPQSMFFLDNQSDNQHQLWRAADKLGLGPNLSMIPRRLGHREMLLKADLLIHPQPQGKSRTLTLQAMAHGLSVLAVEDPWLDYLIEGRTAWMVGDPTPRAYQQRLSDLAAQPSRGWSLGESARQWVREHRLASGMIARTLRLYQALAGEAIAFPG